MFQCDLLAVATKDPIQSFLQVWGERQSAAPGLFGFYKPQYTLAEAPEPCGLCGPRPTQIFDRVGSPCVGPTRNFQRAERESSCCPSGAMLAAKYAVCE